MIFLTGSRGRCPPLILWRSKSVLWRIEGLRDRFLYFNDDVFSDPRRSAKAMCLRMAHTVLRGKWVDYSATAQDLVARDDPALFNYFMQINAAALMGFESSRLFATAHVVHPMRRQHHGRCVCRPATGIRCKHHAPVSVISPSFCPQGLHNHPVYRAGRCSASLRKGLCAYQKRSGRDAWGRPNPCSLTHGHATAHQVPVRQ